MGWGYGDLYASSAFGKKTLEVAKAVFLRQYISTIHRLHAYLLHVPLVWLLKGMVSNKY